MQAPTPLAKRSGLTATTTNTGNGLRLTGKSSTGSQVIITAKENGSRGTATNFTSVLEFSFRQYHWRPYPPQRAVNRANCGTFLLGSHHFSGSIARAETGPVEFELPYSSVKPV